MLSVLASSLANLKFLSLEYLLHSFILSMNNSLLTTPLSRPSHIVVVWDCKNRIFPLHTSHPTHFFSLFLHFSCNLLSISEIKFHFSRFLPRFSTKKRLFSTSRAGLKRNFSQIFGLSPQKSNFKPFGNGVIFVDFSVSF